MCKINKYPDLYGKARGIVRTTGINPSMPGYELLIKAIVIYKVEGKDHLYENLVTESSVIPNTKSPTNGRNNAEQLIFESMKSVGIDYENAMEFIAKLAEKT